MPRLMSVSLTEDAVRARRKTVTRRTGWRTLRPGTRLTLCPKAMGLKKGEKVVRIVDVEVVEVTRERLGSITAAEVLAEGFPDMTPAQFVTFFCDSHQGCRPDSVVTRIRWRYLEEEVVPARPAATLPLFGIESQKSAVVSECGLYRYELTRRWSAGPLVGWVMLNPSSADADLDDPTVRRCAGFAKAWGYGGIVVRNLYALRATDPDELHRHPDPVGPDNDRYLARCAGEDTTVLAWGARGGDRGRDVLALLTAHGAHLVQLAVTGDGQPRHPLYLKADLTPTPVFAAALTAGH